MKYYLYVNENGQALSKGICYIELSNFEIEITEEQYNQINEFPLKLTIENGKVVSWEKTVIELDSEELKRELESLKSERITQSKQQLEEFLQNNPLQFTDGKFYSVTAEKQTLLANALQVYQMKVQAGFPATLKWNATGEECTEWTLEDLSALALAIADYVEPLVTKQQALEVQIKNAQTLEELEAIEINYEVI